MKTEGEIKNGQSRENGTLGTQETGQRQTKQQKTKPQKTKKIEKNWATRTPPKTQIWLAVYYCTSEWSSPVNQKSITSYLSREDL